MITNKEKNFISAIVYVHNNEDTIKYFLKNIDSILSTNFNKYEIICVNDFSTDNSVEIINSTAQELTGTTVSIVNMSFFQGLECSMIAGVDLAIGDFIFEFDSCFIDYNLDIIIDTYNKSLEGYDIVAASPNKNNSITSTIFYKLLNKSCGQNTLQTERFRILSRRAVNRINQNTENIIYRKAVYYNCGLKFNTIKYIPEKKFQSEQDFLYRQHLAIDSIIAFTNLGYKISMSMTILMMVFAFATILYSLVIKVLGIDTAGGWATLVWIISLSFFVLFALISIIIKYLALILKLTNSKTKYSFESIQKVNKN